MVGCGLACPGGGSAGVSGCKFRGSGGGTVGARIRGARGLGPGGGVLGDPYHMGGGGGVATRNTGPYIYIYICHFASRNSLDGRRVVGESTPAVASRFSSGILLAEVVSKENGRVIGMGTRLCQNRENCHQHEQTRNHWLPNKNEPPRKKGSLKARDTHRVPHRVHLRPHYFLPPSKSPPK